MTETFSSKHDKENFSCQLTKKIFFVNWQRKFFLSIDNKFFDQIFDHYFSFPQYSRIFFINFFDHFFDFCLKNREFLKISKISKKVKIDDFFSFHAYNRGFSKKTSFFDLSAHNIVKKSSKKSESIGVTLSIFVDFGHFEKLRDFL